MNGISLEQLKQKGWQKLTDLGAAATFYDVLVDVELHEAKSTNLPADQTCFAPIGNSSVITEATQVGALDRMSGKRALSGL